MENLETPGGQRRKFLKEIHTQPRQMYIHSAA